MGSKDCTEEGKGVPRLRGLLGIKARAPFANGARLMSAACGCSFCRNFSPLLMSWQWKGRIPSGQRLSALFLCYIPDGGRFGNGTPPLPSLHRTQKQGRSELQLTKDYGGEPSCSSATRCSSTMCLRARETSEEMAWGWEILPSLVCREAVHQTLSHGRPLRSCQATSVAWMWPSLPAHPATLGKHLSRRCLKNAKPCVGTQR